MFEMLGPDVIREGRATDAYFERTVETLEAAERNPPVVLEVTADKFPTGKWDLFTGVKDAVHLLEGLPIDVDALAEGRLFDGGPVMRITGRYLDFAPYETALLGFLSHATGFATRALEARLAAPETTLASFGTRHVHPALAPVVERSALLAGFDGFSNVAAGDVLDREPTGTMPHALIICFGRGNQEAAWQAFDDAVDESVPRVALCDTFTDEVDEVVRAVDTLEDRLASVRIDTTGSRRGDFRSILREVRWELDARGREDVSILASGGIDPPTIAALSDVVDGFGVGSYVTDADPLDFAIDVVELDGEPISKRGKLSGVKEAYRSAAGEHLVARRDAPAPAGAEALLEPVIRNGEIVRSFALEEAIELTRSDRAVFED